jgi:L-threonylcarbamoyladenylate synthase
VSIVLDGGPTTVGIESTVLSLVVPDAILLRPGMVSQAEIEAIVGPVRVSKSVEAEAHRAPGMHPRHYSPRTPLILVDNGRLPAGRGAYLWFHHPVVTARSVKMPDDPRLYASMLYEKLHEADAEHLDWIAVEKPPEDPLWSAIRDRLDRAASR